MFLVYHYAENHLLVCRFSCSSQIVDVAAVTESCPVLSVINCCRVTLYKITVLFCFSERYECGKSPICPDHSRRATLPNLSCDGVPDVVIHFKFHWNQFRVRLHEGSESAVFLYQGLFNGLGLPPNFLAGSSNQSWFGRLHFLDVPSLLHLQGWLWRSCVHLCISNTVSSPTFALVTIVCMNAENNDVSVFEWMDFTDAWQVRSACKGLIV